MVPKLYMHPMCPPVRAVLLLTRALDIQLEHVVIERKNDHIVTEKLFQINPQGIIPTLEDGDKVIWDSHAINIYFLSTYVINHDLYPTDPYKRALIDQRLHFDSSLLFPPLRFTVLDLFHKKINKIQPIYVTAIKSAYAELEKFLKDHLWAVGDTVTLADLTLIPTVTSLDIFVPLDPIEYPNITQWIERAKLWPYYEANGVGLEVFRNHIASLN